MKALECDYYSPYDVMNTIEMVKTESIELDTKGKEVLYDKMNMNILYMVDMLYYEEDNETIQKILLKIREQKDIMITELREVYDNKIEKILLLQKSLINTTGTKTKKINFVKKRNTNDNDKKYECDKCGTLFMTKRNLLRHQQTTKKCNHIQIERIYTNATEKVSDINKENQIKNKNKVLKNYERTFIKKIVNNVKNKLNDYEKYKDTDEYYKDIFINKLKKIYNEKYKKYLDYKNKKKELDQKDNTGLNQLKILDKKVILIKKQKTEKIEI